MKKYLLLGSFALALCSMTDAAMAERVRVVTYDKVVHNHPFGTVEKVVVVKGIPYHYRHTRVYRLGSYDRVVHHYYYKDRVYHVERRIRHR